MKFRIANNPPLIFSLADRMRMCFARIRKQFARALAVMKFIKHAHLHTQTASTHHQLAHAPI